MNIEEYRKRIDKAHTFTGIPSYWDELQRANNEIERLRAELAMSDKWRDNYALGLEDSQKTVKHWYEIAQRLREEGRCRHCADYPGVFHEECMFRDFEEIAHGE